VNPDFGCSDLLRNLYYGWTAGLRCWGKYGNNEICILHFLSFSRVAICQAHCFHSFLTFSKVLGHSLFCLHFFPVSKIVICQPHAFTCFTCYFFVFLILTYMHGSGLHFLHITMFVKSCDLPVAFFYIIFTFQKLRFASRFFAF